jgi:hypothetical protein
LSGARRPLPLRRRLIAVTDPLVHALVAVAVVAPLTRRSGPAPLATAVAAATLIDVDHPVAARSLRLGPMLAMDRRPPTHNLTTALLAGALGTLGGGPIHGWAAFGGLASHLLYDAGDSSAPTPLLWPWGTARQLGWRRSCAGLAALALGSLAVSRLA